MSGQGKYRVWWPYKNVGKLKSELAKLAVDEEFGKSMVMEISGEVIQMGFRPRIQKMVRPAGKPVVY